MGYSFIKISILHHGIDIVVNLTEELFEVASFDLTPACGRPSPPGEGICAHAMGTGKTHALFTWHSLPLRAERPSVEPAGEVKCLKTVRPLHVTNLFYAMESSLKVVYSPRSISAVTHSNFQRSFYTSITSHIKIINKLRLLKDFHIIVSQGLRNQFS